VDNEHKLLWIVSIVAVVGIVAMSFGGSAKVRLPQSNAGGDAKVYCFDVCHDYSQGGSAEPELAKSKCCLIANTYTGATSWTVNDGINVYRYASAPLGCIPNAQC
jgi:hypothetical protein